MPGVHCGQKIGHAVAISGVTKSRRHGTAHGHGKPHDRPVAMQGMPPPGAFAVAIPDIGVVQKPGDQTRPIRLWA